VQTTLLGLAIAIILALLAALVGPHFVDWGQYRAELEANASRLIGPQVRASGAIDLELLPTPPLTLTQFEISRPGGAGAVRARKLSVEFDLGALLRRIAPPTCGSKASTSRSGRQPGPARLARIGDRQGGRGAVDPAARNRRWPHASPTP
jgi:hypothetical protein